MAWKIILHECNEVIGIQKEFQIFACQYMDISKVRYLSVWDRKLNFFDGIKGSFWNFQDQSNSLQVIFCWVSQITWTSGYGLWQKTAFFQNLSRLHEFFFCRNIPYFWGTLWTRARKLAHQILIFGVGCKMFGSEQVGVPVSGFIICCVTCKKTRHDQDGFFASTHSVLRNRTIF